MDTEQTGIVALTAKNFHDVVRTDDVIVIDISATWCTPCQAFATVLHDAAAGNNEGVVFATIDADTEPELGTAFNVESIPTIAVMRGGAVIFMHEGSLSERALQDVISQAKATDIEQVRASAARSQVAQ